MLNPLADGRISVTPPPAAPPSAAAVPAPLDVPPEAPRSGRRSSARVRAAILAKGLRFQMGRSQERCGLARVAPTIQALEYRRRDGSRRLALTGRASCRSPMCPHCAAKWQHTRAREIKQAIDNWGAQRVAIVTATMRHHRRMNVGLQHRLLTDAWGNLWSGKAGQLAAAAMGGKPESIRAHDRTWSDERGWHPHLHALVFLQSDAVSDGDVQGLLSQRWPKALRTALRRFNAMCRRVLSQPESPKLWERAQRVFGSRLVPSAPKKGRDGKPLSGRSLHDSVRLISVELSRFSERNISPSLERGVRVERVRQPGQVQNYLAKLGISAHLEVASSDTKLGRVSDDGIRHYGLWEVAELACAKGGGRLSVRAKRAWRELFHATRGKQQITFSSRRRLGLGADPYANADGSEPAEPESTEQAMLLGEIEGVDWDAARKQLGPDLNIMLERAYVNGVLAALPIMRAPAQPAEGPSYAASWHRVRPPDEGPFRRPPEQQQAAEDDAEQRGGRIVAAAVAKATAVPAEPRLAIERLRLEYSELRKGGGGDG